jgi:hypothetical protein
VGTDIVTLLSQSIRTLTIYADSAFLLANGLNETRVNITAIDSLGRPIADNTPIYLTSTSGLVFPGVVYTVSGNATATLRAGTQAPETCWVIATAGAVADSAHVIFKSGPPATVAVNPDTNYSLPTAMILHSFVFTYVMFKTTGCLRARQLHSQSTPNMGTISSFDVTHAVGDTTGYATAIFRASISAGTAIITAICEGATGITRIALNPQMLAL